MEYRAVWEGLQGFPDVKNSYPGSSSKPLISRKIRNMWRSLQEMRSRRDFLDGLYHFPVWRVSVLPGIRGFLPGTILKNSLNHRSLLQDIGAYRPKLWSGAFPLALREEP